LRIISAHPQEGIYEASRINICNLGNYYQVKKIPIDLTSITGSNLVLTVCIPDKVPTHSGDYQKKWVISAGISGTFQTESGGTFKRNGVGLCSGIRSNPFYGH